MNKYINLSTKLPMQIHEINDLSQVNVTTLLEKMFSDITDENIVKNYHPNYSSLPQNIFYILGNNGRYRKGHGTYYILENDGEFISSTGWNEYEYDSSIALLMTRTYISPKFRGTYPIGNTVLQKMIDITRGYKKQWITFNDYNKTLYHWFERANAGKRTALFNDWPEIYKNFKPAGIKTIYNTVQYVAEYNHGDNQ